MIGIAMLVIACESGSVSTTKPASVATPTTSPRALIVFTAWVADPKATSGPEPGYKPALTGLTGHDVQSATADATGGTWFVNISFTPRGANLFAKLTRDNVAACPVDPTSNRICPLRRLGIWLDLMQADIDNWDDPIYAAKVSQPFDLACLMHPSSTAVCPKLV